jgi:nicotinate-nucleotide adenylyltransferase
MKTIALFGTSADPPTAGHQTILVWLAQNYDLVLVWASDNPFKKHQTTLIRRNQMLQLLIDEIKSTSNNIELHPELSDRYTLVTMNKAKAKWGNTPEFSFVIGSDLVEQIVDWYRISELLQQVKLLIVPRPGYEIAEVNLNALKNLGARYTIANFLVPQISSTAYRLQGDTTVLTPAVKTYIERHNLYSFSVVNYQ